MDILNIIDWFIWEPPDTACVPCCGYPIPIPDIVLNHVVFDHDITIELDLDEIYFKEITIKGPVTVRNVINEIYNAYNEEISESFKHKLVQYKTNDPFILGVIEKIKKKESARWYELIGEAEIFPPPPDKDKRRHWTSCTVHMRFEGLNETDKAGVYTVDLGS